MRATMLLVMALVGDEPVAAWWSGSAENSLPVHGTNADRRIV